MSSDKQLDRNMCLLEYWKKHVVLRFKN